jgi:hypothetical protein
VQTGRFCESLPPLAIWPIHLALKQASEYTFSMTQVITDQMRQALEAEHGHPVKLVDEQTSRVYYVISAEMFEVVRALFTDAEFDPREMYPLMSKVAGDAGWDDPIMDAYDNYDDSTVKGEHVDTVDHRDIIRTIGKFSPAIMAQVEEAVKAAMDFP